LKIQGDWIIDALEESADGGADDVLGKVFGFIGFPEVTGFDGSLLQRSSALWKAAGKGHHRCVKLLLRILDPSHDNNKTLRSVFGCNGRVCMNLEVLRVVLKDARVDPSVNNNICLRNAVRYVDQIKQGVLTEDLGANVFYSVTGAPIPRVTRGIEMLLDDARVWRNGFTASVEKFIVRHTNCVNKESIKTAELALSITKCGAFLETYGIREMGITIAALAFGNKFTIMKG